MKHSYNFTWVMIIMTMHAAVKRRVLGSICGRSQTRDISVYTHQKTM
jgi:hypothetical protein